MTYWETGRKLDNGKYVVEQELGRGAFGITYKVRESHTDRLFAVKTLNESLQQRSDFQAIQVKFINEAIKLAKCSHPNIADVTEVFMEDRLWCMVMEYIDGQELANYLRQQGTLSEAEAINIINQVASALSIVHEKNILHRDIKPENILLRKSDLSPVLVDFGFARELVPNLSLQSMSYNGTIFYAPIEESEQKGNFGAWTDIYALAATLYVLVVGREKTPRQPSTIRKIEYLVNKKDPLLPPRHHNPNLSERVNDAILQGMAIESSDRPQSVKKFINLLLPPPPPLIKEKVINDFSINDFDYLEKNKRYVILETLRTTGFCETYLAKNLNLPGNPYCVVKKLDPQSNEEFFVSTARRLFDSEAKTLHKLNNCKSIPRLLAYFEGNNRVWSVQEYIHGQDRDLSINEIAPAQPWLEEKTKSFLLEALEILTVVHQNNIIHRDIKPSNFIRRATDGKITLIDFGAAKEITRTTPEQGNVLTVAIGTPGYMASEQQRGDPRFNSDIYGLGMVAIQALTGFHPDRLPRDRDTGELLWQDRALHCGKKLSSILNKMVRNDFLQRYRTTHEVLRDLKQEFSKDNNYQKTDLSNTKLKEYSYLKTFKFETVKLEEKNVSSGFLGFGKNKQKSVLIKSQKQAKYFTEDLGNNVILDMVEVPAGTFVMGAPVDEQGKQYNESPQHQVTIHSFFIAKFQITQAQWKRIAAVPKVEIELKPNPSNFKGKSLPVENVSWYDAVEFCKRLSKVTRKEYRLPSEAEWEYACRAGTITPFYFGNTINKDLVNYYGKETSDNAVKEEDREKTTPVGCFRANSFGLYDMHGNVFEWCADDWHYNYQEAPNDGSIWTSKNSNIEKVSRGGSWEHFSTFCRSAYRDKHDPNEMNDNLGFRCVAVNII